MVFRNVRMPPLTPYSATFLGRKITSGVLDLDLDYRIERGRLVGKNSVVLKDFTLGERLKSPKAIDLPLDFAMALLTDADGRIRIAVPVQGDVGDPRFDYGQVVRQAHRPDQKTVTAPLKALGAMFGGGAELLRTMAFEPGSDRLLPPEQEKLVYLVQALRQRSKLAVVVPGRFDERLDGRALRSQKAQLALARRLGIALAPGEALAPLAFADARTQITLEEEFVARGRPKALAEFEAEYEKTAGLKVRRVNRWLARLGRASPDVAFYRAMFEQRVAWEPLSATALTALAQRRQQAIVKVLTDAGIGSDRIVTGDVAPVKRSREQEEVPLRLAPI
ncbi:hypothetical protein JCM13664_12530 [Methylothermus subterraneus]